MVICQGNDWKIKKLNLSIKNKTDFLFIKEKKTFQTYLASGKSKYPLNLVTIGPPLGARTAVKHLQ